MASQPGTPSKRYRRELVKRARAALASVDRQPPAGAQRVTLAGLGGRFDAMISSWARQVASLAPGASVDLDIGLNPGWTIGTRVMDRARLEAGGRFMQERMETGATRFTRID